MAQEKYANARYDGGLRFEVESGVGHHTFTLDGDGEAGPSPMDVVLAGLAGCTGIDVVGTLRKMRQDVTDLRVNVRGTRAEDHPKVYTAITVEFIVTGHHLDEAKVRRAVELSETKYCSVSGMLNKTATITTAIRLIEAGETLWDEASGGDAGNEATSAQSPASLEATAAPAAKPARARTKTSATGNGKSPAQASTKASAKPKKTGANA